MSFTQISLERVDNLVDVSIHFAGALPGDFALMMATGNSTLAAPLGFNLLRTTTGHGLVWYKKLDGSEVSDVTASGYVVFVGVWRPNVTFNVVTDNDTGNSEITTSNPAPQTIHASAATGVAILFGFMKGSSAVVPASVSPTMDQSGVSNSHWELFHTKLYNNLPVDHTYDMADEGTNAVTSGYLTFR